MFAARRCLFALGFLTVAACQRSQPSAPPADVAVAPMQPAASGAAAAPSSGPAQASCEQRTAELARWADGLVAEGEYDHDHAPQQAWAKVDVRSSWLPPGVYLYVDATGRPTTLDGSLVPHEANAASAAIREKMARVRNLQKTLNRPEPASNLLVYVDAATPWSRVVDLGKIVAAAGESESYFVVEANPSDAAPPVESPLAAHLRRVARGELTPEEKNSVLQSPPPVSPDIARCAPAVALSKTLAGEPHTPRSKTEKLAKELPRSIHACDCDVDFPGVQARLWDMMNRFSGRPVAALPLTLAPKATPLAESATSSWKTAVAAVSAASKAGKPVTLAVR